MTKRIRLRTKPLKMTYPIYLIQKKFGKDLGALIMSFLFQCDECFDLEIGPIFCCQICSYGKDLCLSCWDLKGFHCFTMPCFKCWYCGEYHCREHNDVMSDNEERFFLSLF